MRLSALAVVLLSLLASPAVACDFFSDDGRLFSWIEHDDYSFEVASADGHKTLCVTLRSPEQTVGACDDGSESDLSRDYDAQGADIIRFDNAVWRLCQPGFNLDGELGAEY